MDPARADLASAQTKNATIICWFQFQGAGRLFQDDLVGDMMVGELGEHLLHQDWAEAACPAMTESQALEFFFNDLPLNEDTYLGQLITSASLPIIIALSPISYEDELIMTIRLYRGASGLQRR
jgi:hypothetical protein